MPGSSSIRVGIADWTNDPLSNTATAPSTAAHGVNITLGRAAKDVHVGIIKTNVTDVSVWVRGTYGGTTRWAIADIVQFSETANEVQRYEGLSAFDGVAVRRRDTNVGNINAFVGLSEA